jgi:orotidine-5'-phosphate decarboxylase
MNNPILAALDVDTLPDALRLVEQLRDHVGGFKVGLELCTNVGMQTVIAAVSAAGGEIFVDLKFKDIPNTVAAAARAVSRPGVMFFNVHADGGAAMMRAALEAANASAAKPKVMGVTVLTSMDEATLNNEVRVPGALVEQAVHLAKLAQSAGLAGVVCSAHEVAAIKAACGADFQTVVPGVRPSWAEANDQRRVMTPAEAIRVGANYLVIGRPITRPPEAIGSPADAAQKILEEIAGVRQ